MTFERKIYQKLVNWKSETSGTKAILIEGARRIGKSTIAVEFAKNEYDSYMLIDFSIASKEVKSYFEKYITDIDTLFMLLEAEYHVQLKKRKSLVIFDEVQFCPKAREAIKHLVKDGRFDYLETGSLISVKENVKNILIPSEERHIKMYPFDFEEFLWALNEKPLANLIRSYFKELKSLPNSLHDKAMLLFREYLLVGGMPQSIVAFLENSKSLNKANIEKKDILNLYRSDIMKISSSYKSKVLAIFEQIPGFLSQHEKRIVFNKIQKDSSFNNYEDTFFWLSDSQITNECFLCNDPNVGLSLNENRTYIKCYMGDTGLLVTHAFNENEIENNNLYSEILSGDLSINNGMIFENAIAQALTANGYKLFFYTHYSEEKHRNDIEIDFIISNNSKVTNKIFPIEVKSGKRYHTKSLDRFIERYKDRIGEAYIIHPRNLSIKDNGIICLPSYMVFCL
ncbi:MAG: ATP-binding protein [Anaeroplasmataceae bacterium]